MKLEDLIKKMDKETLVVIVLRVIDQFPVIQDALIRMFNENGELTK